MFKEKIQGNFKEIKEKITKWWYESPSSLTFVKICLYAWAVLCFIATILREYYKNSIPEAWLFIFDVCIWAGILYRPNVSACCGCSDRGNCFVQVFCCFKKLSLKKMCLVEVIFFLFDFVSIGIIMYCNPANAIQNLLLVVLKVYIYRVPHNCFEQALNERIQLSPNSLKFYTNVFRLFKMIKEAKRLFENVEFLIENKTPQLNTFNFRVFREKSTYIISFFYQNSNVNKY